MTLWLELQGRGTIRVSGEDRARLLHAMTTNHIQQLTPGTGCYAYFLSAQGRILSDAHVLCREDALVLDTEAESREKVLQHLDRYIIADDVVLEDESAALATIAVDGPEATPILRAIHAPIPDQDYGSVAWRGGLVAKLSVTGRNGYFLIIPKVQAGELTDHLESADAVAGTVEQFRILRLEQGKPRYGEDLSERFLSQEANQMHALSFTKGCYLGQEIVERVRSRGQVHRVLMPLEIDAATAPEAGTKILEGGVAVAEITSAAYSASRGKVVALAYVRSDRSNPGTEIDWEGGKVRVGKAYSKHFSGSGGTSTPLPGATV